jgi:hypothetical protein
MGYELELISRHDGPDPAIRRRMDELERRRAPARHRLATALDDLRALSCSPTDPAVLAVAQLRVASARRAKRALAEECRRLEAEMLLRGIWR